MNDELINQLVTCVLDASDIEDTQGSMEARLPLYAAEKIWKQLNPEELLTAEKKIILEFLKKKNYTSAVNWLVDGEWPFNRGAIITDPQIKQAAEQAYTEASSGQMEIAEGIKKNFNIV